MGKIFVNKEIEVIKGEDASRLINEKNEMKFFEDGIGIKKIDKIRWLEAQYYERKTWCNSAAKAMITDRNEEHQKNFDYYKILPSILENDLSVIELGCGPYTNLRFILPSIRKSIDCVDLLDPLINDYMLNSPNCTYKNSILGIYQVNTFNTSIEEFKNTRKYNLVVMINVLDHCFDMDLVFEKISDIIREDGILLLEERVYKGKDKALKESIENTYDAGHPLRISEEYFNSKLSLFKPLYSREFIRDNVIDKYLILQK